MVSLQDMIMCIEYYPNPDWRECSTLGTLFEIVYDTTCEGWTLRCWKVLLDCVMLGYSWRDYFRRCRRWMVANYRIFVVGFCFLVGVKINLICLWEVYAWFTGSIWIFHFSADTGELVGDPPELAAGINEDLHLLFGELVGVLNLGYGFTLRSVEDWMMKKIFSPEYFLFWTTTFGSLMMRFILALLRRRWQED